ncbi:lipoamide acyltransferase component of branched-chain alpha-keto acid dehydrogenase complex [Shouchella lehensis G1]|uniref:Dihydrolipoamide acetyltransferase component of pyruvate dehydrogenase complex n=2 Tax=Bacillaceae TaxID=186817 RepID=A0A060M4K7_9BACI|nr:MULTISPECIES: dihydrolipoamide acetyltransferase family protein [Bacillaceae]AIC95004.1 lipoamide acyltransferase component of branched-chain alpha-keto acid dehydrogenase complex [Shouchella lehensis G1]
MATNMTMPQLGESVTEGTISKWLVAPGDKVTKYEPIAEVMTDKVSAEIPSSYTGTIQALLVKEEDTVSVGTAICSIEEEGSSQEEKPSETPNEADVQPNVETTEEKTTDQRQRYSPAVLRLSQDYGIDLADITGSGKGGRITRKDVEAYRTQNGVANPQQGDGSKVSVEKHGIKSTDTPSSSVASADDERIPVSGVRKAIATNMVKSKTEAPHAWTMIEVDVTNLVKVRQGLKDSFKEKEGFSLTYLPFFMKACVEALKEFPEVNAQWVGDAIIRKKDIHLSMAVATEDALYVPVIKHADELTVKGLAKRTNELATKVRTGQLKSDDMTGGTFTINNTGSFGSILSQPIINTPQAAILSVESIVKRPVVLDTEAGEVIAIRHMVNLCLSLDHRVLDGLICGKFLQAIKTKLEAINETTSVY